MVHAEQVPTAVPPVALRKVPAGQGVGAVAAAPQ